jgi:hypothetical protein
MIEELNQYRKRRKHYRCNDCRYHKITKPEESGLKGKTHSSTLPTFRSCNNDPRYTTQLDGISPHLLNDFAILVRLVFKLVRKLLGAEIYESTIHSA